METVIRDTRINHIKCTRVLAPTGISIAPYVINPYRGCLFGCIYCYSQKNKCFRNQKAGWGEFVDIKINSPEILARELNHVNPERVLLGSITEVYQSVEKEYGLTRKILEILNHHRIPVTILTKSDLILRDIDLLGNSRICFSINLHDEGVRKQLEPQSTSIKKRIQTVKTLRENGIYTYIHIGPVLPGLTSVSTLMKLFNGITDRLDFESFNLWMAPIEKLKGVLPSDITRLWEEIYCSEQNYNKYWNDLKENIIDLNRKFNYKLNIYFHPFTPYWNIPLTSKGVRMTLRSPSDPPSPQ